jgi:hypothetical protein
MLRTALGLWMVLGVGTAPAARAHPSAQLGTEAENIAVAEMMAFRKAPSVQTHPSGRVVGKDAYIASILAGKAAIGTSPAKDVRIGAPGGWTAVPTGTCRLSAPAGESCYAVGWTTVYVRGERGSEVAASHASRLQDPK